MTSGAKPTTRRKRRLINRGGRPPLTGVERSRSGRLSKAEQQRRADARKRDTMAVAMAARQKHLGLSADDAVHHDAPIVAWRWWKRGEIQERHFQAAVALSALHADYLKAIKCPGLLPAEPGASSKNSEGGDPDYIEWCSRKRGRWLAIRHDLLGAGSLTLLAAQAVAIENRDMVSLIPDFREAMNIVHRRIFSG